MAARHQEKTPRVYVWYDLSPEDGCSLVDYRMLARSVSEVAHAVAGLPSVQHRTVSSLLKEGRIRVNSRRSGVGATQTVEWSASDGEWRPA